MVGERFDGNVPVPVWPDLALVGYGMCEFLNVRIDVYRYDANADNNYVFVERFYPLSPWKDDTLQTLNLLRHAFGGGHYSVLIERSGVLPGPPPDHFG